MFQQPLLAPEPCAVSDQFPIFSYDSVTGNNNGYRIVMIGISNSTERIWPADGSGHILVGGYSAEWDFFKVPPYRCLEIRTLELQGNRKCLANPAEIVPDLKAAVLHHIRQIPRIGLGFIDKLNRCDMVPRPDNFNIPDW